MRKRIVWTIKKDIENLPKDFIIDVVIGVSSVTRVSPSASDGDSRVVAVKTEKPIVLDGYLNETQWEAIEPISDFTQRELTEGADPTEKTEVRIMYDDENLYFGIMCYDSEPDKIIHKELKWDGGGVTGRGRFTPIDDMFTFVIDTYNDKRTGLYFAVNPNGAQYDGSFENGDYQINFNWNGIWEVRSRITDYGWSSEIAIPFKTLRFPTTDTQEWAINFMRNIRRKNEEVLWRGWGRNDGINRLSKTGTLLINEPLKKSYKMDITPYLLTGVEKEAGENKNDVFFYCPYDTLSHTGCYLMAYITGEGGRYQSECFTGIEGYNKRNIGGFIRFKVVINDHLIIRDSIIVDIRDLIGQNSGATHKHANNDDNKSL
ncbi:hypothetical protein ES708_17925 [subsurface metagenome]